MLREFQEEIARLKAELAASGSAAGSLGSISSSAGAEASSSAAGSVAELSEEEVARMRQQLEADLRAEYSSGGVELDAATLEQVRDCRKRGGWAWSRSCPMTAVCAPTKWPNHMPACQVIASASKSCFWYADTAGGGGAACQSAASGRGGAAASQARGCQAWQAGAAAGGTGAAGGAAQGTGGRAQVSVEAYGCMMRRLRDILTWCPESLPHPHTKNGGGYKRLAWVQTLACTR